MVFRKRRRESEDAFALYYASDVHGSDQCWRKFLGAGRFYEVNALIMGGDLTGKAVVPDRARRRRRRSRPSSSARPGSGSGETALAELTEAVRYNGMYPWVASADEIARHRARRRPPGPSCSSGSCSTSCGAGSSSPTSACRRRGSTSTRWPGNDDPWSCDAILEGAAHLIACDLRVTEVGGHEMISCSYANPTPWASPRELDEDALYDARQAARRPARASRDGDLQPARAAEGVGARHRLRDRRPAPHRRAQRQAARDPRRLDGGAAADRGVPAAARAARPHPRVARRDDDRQDARDQLRLRVCDAAASMA